MSRTMNNNRDKFRQRDSQQLQSPVALMMPHGLKMQ